MKRSVKPIYTAPTVDASRAALDDLTESCGKKYGAIIGGSQLSTPSPSPSETPAERRILLMKNAGHHRYRDTPQGSGGLRPGIEPGTGWSDCWLEGPRARGLGG